jgi:hypothetical protein
VESPTLIPWLSLMTSSRSRMDSNYEERGWYLGSVSRRVNTVPDALEATAVERIRCSAAKAAPQRSSLTARWRTGTRPTRCCGGVLYNSSKRGPEVAGARTDPTPGETVRDFVGSALRCTLVRTLTWAW